MSKKLPLVDVKYYPHKGQMPFHKDRYRVRNRGLFGGTSTGKTRAGAFELLSWCIENPGCSGAAFAPSYRMIVRNVIPTLESLLGVPGDLERSKFVEQFQKTEMRVDFNTFTRDKQLRPSRVWFLGLERPESAEGMNLDFAWLDEAGRVPRLEPAWRSIMRRLRGSGNAMPFDGRRSPQKAIGLWVTTTPDSVGSNLWTFFEDSENRNPDSRVYRMSLFDNAKHLDKTFIDEMVRVHGGDLYKQYIEGLFTPMGAGAFSFDYSIHVVDEGDFGGEHYILKQDGLPLVPLEAIKRRLVGGVDFGWVEPSAILLVGFDGDGRAFVLDEFYGSRVSPQGLVNECLLLEKRHGRCTFWCDSSRPDNIAVMSREGIDARGNKSKRDDGIAEIGGRFQDAGDGLRRIYVMRNCVNLIKELQTYDPDKKERDHAVDALRYGIMGGKGPGGTPVAVRGYRRR